MNFIFLVRCGLGCSLSQMSRWWVSIRYCRRFAFQWTICIKYSDAPFATVLIRNRDAYCSWTIDEFKIQSLCSLIIAALNRWMKFEQSNTTTANIWYSAHRHVRTKRTSNVTIPAAFFSRPRIRDKTIIESIAMVFTCERREKTYTPIAKNIFSIRNVNVLPTDKNSYHFVACKRWDCYAQAARANEYEWILDSDDNLFLTLCGSSSRRRTIHEMLFGFHVNAIIVANSTGHHRVCSIRYSHVCRMCINTMTNDLVMLQKKHPERNVYDWIKGSCQLCLHFIQNKIISTAFNSRKVVRISPSGHILNISETIKN